MPVRLRELRASLGLSQEKLARRLGVSFATVNRWENGRSRMSERAVAALKELAAESLGAAPATGDGRSAPDPPSSTFIGRERELAELRDLSAGHRLIRLVGPGGTGKTRLAAELARRLEHEQGVLATFVALEPLRSPRLVTSAIAAQLGVRDGPDGAAAERLVPALTDAPRVLVLDAAEQVRDSVVEASYELLDASERALLPQLSIFAGPCTVEDAHAVTGTAISHLVYSIRALVDASWLHVRSDGHQHSSARPGPELPRSASPRPEDERRTVFP